MLAIKSPQARQAVNPELTQSLESQGIRWQLKLLDGECTDEAIKQLQANTAQQGAAAILTTCAAWSPVAIVYNAQGAHLRSQPLRKMPALCHLFAGAYHRREYRAGWTGQQYARYSTHTGLRPRHP